MSGIDIRAAGAHEYVLRLGEPERELTLRVPVEFLERVAVTDPYEPIVARRTAEYVVAHGLVGALPDVFTPADVERLVPGYPGDISARIG